MQELATEIDIADRIWLLVAMLPARDQRLFACLCELFTHHQESDMDPERIKNLEHFLWEEELIAARTVAYAAARTAAYAASYAYAADGTVARQKQLEKLVELHDK